MLLMSIIDVEDVRNDEDLEQRRYERTLSILFF